MARQGMRSDNVEYVPEWVWRQDLDPAIWTAANDILWSWTCPDCGTVLTRDDIAEHRAAEARHEANAIVWMLGAIGAAALVALAVVVVRWPK